MLGFRAVLTNRIILSFIFSLLIGGSYEQGCNYTWVTRENRNVLGGSLLVGVSNLPDCRVECVARPACTGIDFDGASRCWIITTDGQWTNDTTGLVTHYQLLRNVNSCVADACSSGQYSSWKESRDSHVIGGRPGGKITWKACLEKCNSNKTCWNFDWDEYNSGDTCWLIEYPNNNPVQKDSPNVHSFKRECVLSGVYVGQISTIANIPRRSDAMTIQPVTVSTAVPASPVTARRVAEAYIAQPTTIKPAYIVLIAMGIACLLLVAIAIIVICNYPLKGGRDRIESTTKTTSSTKVKKFKKIKKSDKNGIQDHRPTSYGDDEEIGMSNMNGVHSGSNGYQSGAETALAYSAAEAANDANEQRESYNDAYKYGSGNRSESAYNKSQASNRESTYNKSTKSESPYDQSGDPYNKSHQSYDQDGDNESDRHSDQEADTLQRDSYGSGANTGHIDYDTRADRDSSYKGSTADRNSDYNERPTSGGYNDDYNTIREEAEDDMNRNDDDDSDYQKHNKDEDYE